MSSPSEESRARRLLVVDDDHLIVQMVDDFFAPHNFEVVSAEDGRKALEVLADWTPDVIVADILMPVMDGWDLFEEVRRRPETAEIPFVFLTVETELPSRLRGLNLGADDYVTKPFQIEELHARVERILERRRQLERARAGEEALLSGTAEHLAISDLLQILALNNKDGIVHLKQRGDEGYIVFETGRIIHAACGRVKGTKALFRMLGWSTAMFRVLPHGGGFVEKTIDAPSTNVIMDGVVSLDEWIRLRELIPPMETVLELAADAKARMEGQPITPAEFEVMAGAKGGASVGAILERSRLPDADLAEAVCMLMTRGVVRTRE